MKMAANAGIDLEHVDVEVDGGVEGGEQVGDAGEQENHRRRNSSKIRKGAD